MEAGRGNGELTCGAVASVLGSSDSSDLSPLQDTPTIPAAAIATAATNRCVLPHIGTTLGPRSDATVGRRSRK